MATAARNVGETGTGSHQGHHIVLNDRAIDPNGLILGFVFAVVGIIAFNFFGLNVGVAGFEDHFSIAITIATDAQFYHAFDGAFLRLGDLLGERRALVAQVVEFAAQFGECGIFEGCYSRAFDAGELFSFCSAHGLVALFSVPRCRA